MTDITMIENLAKEDEKDIVLRDPGSPMSSGLGMNDIVHFGKNQVMTVPVLPLFNNNDDDESTTLKNETVMAKDHLTENGSPLCGITGMNDIVHLGKGVILNVPILPFQDDEDDE